MDAFLNRIRFLDNEDQAQIPLLMTSAIGLSSETGEFNEIVKKILFQGKPLTDDNVFHMKRELGDILWYWINACRALKLNPNEVVRENIEKLKARYPDLIFNAERSENRSADDL
jgi:NTP pyrophosphatase (non-canonical NTP hydrolase)